MKTSEVTPQIYVGTYAKYNNGSIEGAWLDLTDYSTKEEFYEACKELHKDEIDPEFMFQDYEGFPKRFYSESGLDDDLFEYLETIKDLDEDRAEAYNLFVEHTGSEDFSDFEEAYCGQYKDEEDYAYELVDELGYLNEMPENLRYYFDYEKFARDLFMSDYWIEDGHVFRNI